MSSHKDLINLCHLKPVLKKINTNNKFRKNLKMENKNNKNLFPEDFFDINLNSQYNNKIHPKILSNPIPIKKDFINANNNFKSNKFEEIKEENFEESLCISKNINGNVNINNNININNINNVNVYINDNSNTNTKVNSNESSSKGNSLTPKDTSISFNNKNEILKSNKKDKIQNDIKPYLFDTNNNNNNINKGFNDKILNNYYTQKLTPSNNKNKNISKINNLNNKFNNNNNNNDDYKINRPHSQKKLIYTKAFTRNLQKKNVSNNLPKSLNKFIKTKNNSTIINNNSNINKRLNTPNFKNTPIKNSQNKKKILTSSKSNNILCDINSTHKKIETELNNLLEKIPNDMLNEPEVINKFDLIIRGIDDLKEVVYKKSSYYINNRENKKPYCVNKKQ